MRVIGQRCILLGAGVYEGAARRGCEDGPSAIRAAGLAETLTDLGYDVVDAGDVVPEPKHERHHGNAAIKFLPEIVAWTEAIAKRVYQAAAVGAPILLGGDHSLAAGSLSGLSRRAHEEGRELFVVWLDAHPDFHTLETTRSGNLHGAPLAYATGQPGFVGVFPRLLAPVKPRNICMIGLRSVDLAERRTLSSARVVAHDMRAIRRQGARALLEPFLARVAAENGVLHVSFDADFLDPGLAPGVGTPVPGGATAYEARHIMEILRDSGLLRSLDLAELNPTLDQSGRTALVMIDLVATLMGDRSIERPERSKESWRKDSTSSPSSASRA